MIPIIYFSLFLHCPSAVIASPLCLLQEAIQCAAALVTAVMPFLPDVKADEWDRCIGPGDPDEPHAAESRLRDALFTYYNPEVDNHV